MLIAGGTASNDLDIVELFNLETLTSCVINVKLDKTRYRHTGDGNLVCGGWDNTPSPIIIDNIHSTCFNVKTRETINLMSERLGHTSWSTASGVFLLGGIPSSNLRGTELITGTSTQLGFALQYDTK